MAEPMYAVNPNSSIELMWWVRARSEIIYECMKRIIPGDVKLLDIGSGYGIMINLLKKFGTVTAIEPYEDAANYMDRTINIKTYNCTFESFKDNAKYDVVSGFDVLEHIEDDMSALLKIDSLLVNGGFLVLTVPAYQFLWSHHDDFIHHFRRYTLNELVDKIPADFIIRKASYFNTLLFPAALLDKLLLSQKKISSSLTPHKLLDSVLYAIFSVEKYLLRFINLPFGVSIILIAEKAKTD
jgi:2-polyprenyl-3-methyl-5-hydroxy-6-metoxy-1,4-benzoquinol methylase